MLVFLAMFVQFGLARYILIAADKTPKDQTLEFFHWLIRLSVNVFLVLLVVWSIAMLVTSLLFLRSIGHRRRAVNRAIKD